jgi:hypothetical protein
MIHLRYLLASLAVVTLFSWAAHTALPVWFNAAVLGGLVVFVAVAGLIKLALITLTPPRQ